MKLKWKKLVFLTAAATVLSANICAYAEDTESRRFSILQTEGKDAYLMKKEPRRLSAKAGMNVSEGNQLITGKESHIYVEADEDKTLKLDANTTVSVEKASSKSLKLVLKNGKLFFNVENPLKEDEEMEFKAAQTSMSIRGTSGFITYNPMTLMFHLVNGKVQWKLENGEIIEVRGGQLVKLVRDWGDDEPGPGSDAGYILEIISDFTWRDLSIEQLKTLLENREQVDLSEIGLGSEEEIRQAEAAVAEYEEQKRLEELEKWIQHHKNDRDEKDDQEDKKEEVIPDEGMDDSGEEIIPDEDTDDPDGEIMPGEEEYVPDKEVFPDDDNTDAPPTM